MSNISQINSAGLPAIIISNIQKPAESKAIRTYTSVIASMTETACLTCAALSVGLLFSPLVVDSMNFSNEHNQAILTVLIATPILGSIASQFANPKTVEKKAEILSKEPIKKKPLNMNRMVTNSAFALSWASFAAFCFVSKMGENLQNTKGFLAIGFLAGRAVGSLSSLVEKYAFKSAI